MFATKLSGYSAVGIAMLCVAGSAYSASQDLAVKTVTVPSWNIITATMDNFIPLVNGEDNPFVVKQICDLARGDKSQQEVNDFLLKNKINPENLRKSDGPESLLVNGDLRRQQASCIGYLSSFALRPIDIAAYIKNTDVSVNDDHANKTVKSQVQKEKQENSSSIMDFFRLSSRKESQSVEKENDVPPAKKEVRQTFNQTQFIADARLKVAVTAATAQLYAVIAANIKGNGPTTWQGYQQRITSVIENYAPEYFASIKQNLQAGERTQFVLENVALAGFTMSGSDGSRLIQDGSNIQLVSRGVPWFGAGKVFGNQHNVEVVIIKDAQKKGTKKSRK